MIQVVVSIRGYEKSNTNSHILISSAAVIKIKIAYDCKRGIHISVYAREDLYLSLQVLHVFDSRESLVN